jgi:hypothetical protein
MWGTIISQQTTTIDFLSYDDLIHTVRNISLRNTLSGAFKILMRNYGEQGQYIRMCRIIIERRARARTAQAGSSRSRAARCSSNALREAAVFD